MASQNPKAGVSLAFVCLFILGVMPIISNSRPAGFDALSFAFFLSVWQLLFSLPLVLREVASPNKGIFDSGLPSRLRRRTVAIILLTGTIFGLSTYVYVVAMEKAGAVSAAIAIQAYPLFAILWETLFLNRRKTPTELAFTVLLLAALYYLATGGTGRIEGFSFWFVFALAIPFLWSVAHVVIKEVLDKTPITPAQVTFFRVLVSSIFLGVVLLAAAGPDAVMRDLGNLDFQKFALLMGFVYYLELINWFYAVRYIDVSVASSIAVPAPALTMVLAVPLLGEAVEAHQVIALGVVIVSLYGLLYAGARKR
ncbi:MAG: DMT family transporter [Minwuiales bacterium]|nr:DMT family transporter [Minwuiales bacterium]